MELKTIVIHPGAACTILLNTHKVGTSTWMNHFLYLYQGKEKAKIEELKQKSRDGLPNINEKLHQTIPQMFKISKLNGSTNIANLAQRSTSFSMVRHPFERYYRL